jgi:hypothetical protein
MSWIYNRQGEVINEHKILVETPEGKRVLGVNGWILLKMDIKEIGYGNV